jgi:hypothetical protein
MYVSSVILYASYLYAARWNDVIIKWHKSHLTMSYIHIHSTHCHKPSSINFNKAPLRLVVAGNCREASYFLKLETMKYLWKMPLSLPRICWWGTGRENKYAIVMGIQFLIRDICPYSDQSNEYSKVMRGNLFSKNLEYSFWILRSWDWMLVNT